LREFKNKNKETTMKHLFYLVLGILIVILTSATTVSVMTVKPATPKSVAVFSDNYSNEELMDKIKSYVKKGYVLKSIAGSGKQYTDTWIVVMEKY
jgi:serine kinase of HPr protein (carbohydrate metabolism regulator)